MCVCVCVCYMPTRLSYMKTLHLSKLYTCITYIQDLFFQMSNTKTI